MSDQEQLQNPYRLRGTTAQVDAIVEAERQRIYAGQQTLVDITQAVAAACFPKNSNGSPDRTRGEHPCKVRMPSGEILLCGYNLAIEAIVTGKGELVADPVAEIIAGDPPRRFEDCPPPVAEERNTHADPPRERPRSRK
jgi:hypothetical protein